MTAKPKTPPTAALRVLAGLARAYSVAAFDVDGQKMVTAGELTWALPRWQTKSLDALCRRGLVDVAVWRSQKSDDGFAVSGWQITPEGWKLIEEGLVFLSMGDGRTKEVRAVKPPREADRRPPVTPKAQCFVCDGLCDEVRFVEEIGRYCHPECFERGQSILAAIARGGYR